MAMIFETEIEKILKHPLQDKIYSTEIDSAFLESIKARGILQPLLLAKNAIIENDEIKITDKFLEEFVLVSGHRRLMGAANAGLKTVPCVLKSYANTTVLNIDYLESNRQRTKTKNEIKGEFNEYKQILCQIAKYKINKGDKSSLNDIKDEGAASLPTGVNIDFSEAVDFLSRIGIKVDEKFEVREALQKATGLPRDQVRGIIKVEDENYMIKKLDYFEKKGIASKTIQELQALWFDIREKYSQNKITLENAVEALDEVFEKIEQKIAKNEKNASKKPEKEKAKCYLSLPITGREDAEILAEAFEEELSEKYEVLNPVKFIKALEKKAKKQFSWAECMQVLLVKLSECKYYAPRGIDRNLSNGCVIEDVFAMILNKKGV